MRSQRLIRLFIVVSLSSANAWAVQRTFVSAATGDDANPCSRALPCRSFAAAIVLADPDGEVIVLDSGGYGAVAVLQPVSLISPSGVHAAITAFSGNAITVNAGDPARVVLRNLALSSQGGTNGIEADTVAALHIEGCLISGFSDTGIMFAPTTSGARLYVDNTIVRRSGNSGINVTGGTDICASIESARLYQNGVGAYAQGARATIRKSIAAGSTYEGFGALFAPDVDVEDSVAMNNSIGFSTAFSTMTVVRCEVTSNAKGMSAQSFSTIYVSDSTIASNVLGLDSQFMSTIASRGNNTLEANTTNGGFSGSFPAQ